MNNNKIVLRLNMNRTITPIDTEAVCISKSLFLAGPITEWRDYAIKYLRDHGFDGIIYNPEVDESQYNDNYDNQFKWEHDHLDSCDLIVFWIPRDVENNILGLSTNVEFGLYANSNKVIAGSPNEEKYIYNCCQEHNIPWFTNLDELLDKAIEILSVNKFRVDNECNIPAFIWENKEFQNWYQKQKEAGNTLLSLKCLYSFVMPKAKKLFLWICHVKMYVASEQRIKENEFVISRTNVVSIIMHYKDNIVLIKEYRSPCCNGECYVYELPGGSSVEDDAESDNIYVAKQEVFEETGINIDYERFKLINTRQCLATLSAHNLTAFEVELTKEEFNIIKNNENSIHGLLDDSELTYLTIKPLTEILDNSLVDWTNLGIILSALYQKD